MTTGSTRMRLAMSVARASIASRSSSVMVASFLIGGAAVAQAPGWVVRGQDAAVGADQGDWPAAVVGAHAVPGPRVGAAGGGRGGHRSTPASRASRRAASTYGGYELAAGTRARRSSRVARASAVSKRSIACCAILPLPIAVAYVAASLSDRASLWQQAAIAARVMVSPWCRRCDLLC